MQRQYPAQKSNSGSSRKSKKSQTTSLKIISLLFGLTLLVSCGTSKLKNQALNIGSIEEAVRSICLAGEGRGQIRFLAGDYSFDYETVLNKKNAEWALGVNLPFYGEEILRLTFKDAYKAKYKLRGSFASRLSKEGRKNKANHYLLRKFLKKYALFLKFYTGIDEASHSCDDQKGYCKLISGDIFYYQYSTKRLEVIFKEKNNISFHLIFSHGDQNKFRRIRAYLENHREAGLRRKPILLDLIMDQCI